MSERRSGGGFGSIVAVLIVVGLIAKFIWWVLAVVGAALVIGLFGWALHRVEQRRIAELARIAAIAARADEQHAQIMAGDDRGIYGAYPPVEPPRGPRGCRAPPARTGSTTSPNNADKPSPTRRGRERKA